MAQSTRKIAGDETVHYVSPRSKRQRGSTKMQPPLTPMIDVTFQLLLFFILTFTFRPDEGQIPGTLPQKGAIAQAQQVLWDKPILIDLRPTGDVLEGVVYEMSGVNLTIDSPQELFEHLVARREILGDEVPVVIHPRRDVRWRHVVDAFNQSVRARLKNIGFAASY